MTKPTNLMFPVLSTKDKIDPQQTESYRVAVVEWSSGRDGIAEIIHDELTALGHRPVYFKHAQIIPKEVDVVFSFAPYGEFMPIACQMANIPLEYRPTLVHWNTEGLPDLRIPWFLVRTIGTFRSWLGRLSYSDNHRVRALAGKLTSFWKTRILRFRYVGDYYYAYRKGWLNVFADSSAVYARIHQQHGLPTIVAPWGATQRWYDDLGLERDIDVLWMGKRGAKRRSDLLDRVREELRAHRVEIYIADNEENPFIFGEERTRFLNRAKITLNLTRTWYDDNFSRFAMAIPNRSLIASEPLLPHCPQYKAGVHYVSTPVDSLTEMIVYYLKHDDERLRIVENAYQLVTTELTWRNSIKTIMEAVRKVRRQNTHL